MLNQTEKILRWLCLVLAALIVWQLGRAAFRATILTRVAIPAVPTLATNEPASAAAGPTRPAAGTATNATSAQPGTNAVSGTNTVVGTNQAAAISTNAVSLKPDTNAAASGTNSIATTNQTVAVTNAPAVSTSGETNGAATNASIVATNPVVAVTSNAPATPAEVAHSGTNDVSAATNSTAASTAAVAPTNRSVAAGTNTAPAGTNAAAKMAGKKNDGPSGLPPALGGGGAPKPGQPGGKLPPEIQARLDKIVDSEIFGPVIRPQPMALLGIAGDVAFLRSPSGQTGLVKEGDSLGEIKLLRIGINRVLVEQSGQKKELTVFNGYGGESLLPKSNETSP